MTKPVKVGIYTSVNKLKVLVFGICDSRLEAKQSKVCTSGALASYSSSLLVSEDEKLHIRTRWAD